MTGLEAKDMNPAENSNRGRNEGVLPLAAEEKQNTEEGPGALVTDFKTGSSQPPFEESFRKPWMSDAERVCIAKYLSPSFRVVEWGCGGSTLYFSRQVKHWVSIEHDAA